MTSINLLTHLCIFYFTDVHRAHLALFYLNGVFYHIAKRLTGVQYVSNTAQSMKLLVPDLRLQSM